MIVMLNVIFYYHTVKISDFFAPVASALFLLILFGSKMNILTRESRTLKLSQQQSSTLAKS